jgi:hypothetical protein
MKRLSAAATAVAFALLAAGLILIVGQSPGASAQGAVPHTLGHSIEYQSTTPWTILVDDYEPQPLAGQPIWYTNRLGGDRGRIDGPGGGTVQWGTGVVTATITGGTSSWQGVWTSLNHPIADCAPLDFSAIFPPAIEPQYQGVVSALRFHILDGQGLFSVELRIGENTYCPPQIPVPAWPGDSVALTGGAQTVTFMLPPDVGQVGALNWLVLGSAGDFAVVDRVELLVDLPDLEAPAQRAFLHSYGMLLNNWDPATGLTRDRASWKAGDFDNVSASGLQAAGAVMAWHLGFISRASATGIVTKTTEALLALPTDACGGNLWPHFVHHGQIVPGTEWSSIDTAIALLALIEARQALDLETTEVETVLTSIAWDDLVLTDGHLSHGYRDDCQPIEPTGEGGWRDFGTESWLINFAYAAANGNVADFDHTPPTYNGSGFIDELAWLLVPAPCQDRWGTGWIAYREQAADAQLAYYQEHPCYGGPPRLFGLSAAEVPDLSAVPDTQIYQAFGVGGEIPPNDGTDLLGHAVITPHYAGLAASLRPDEAAALWEWLEGQGLFTPLNNVESLMFVDEPTCEDGVWNGLKGSWNLSLQMLGWGRLLSAESHPLYAAMWSNDRLSQGYRVMGTLYCQIYLPLISRESVGEGLAPRD